MAGAEITYVADRRFIADVGRAALGAGSRFPRAVGGMIVLDAFGVIAIARGRVWLGVAALAAGLLATAVVVLFLRARRRIEDAVRRQYAGLPEPVRITVRVDDDGMTFTNARTSEPLPWAGVARVREGRRVWFVDTTTGLSLPIRAEAVGADAAAIIRANAPRA